MVDSLRVRGLLDVESLRFALGSVVARHALDRRLLYRKVSRGRLGAVD